jgi:hypothetical protein
MNPLGFVIIGLGLIMMVIGFKGTQHQILSDLTGKGGATSPAATAAGQTGNTGNSGDGTAPVTAV